MKFFSRRISIQPVWHWSGPAILCFCLLIFPIVDAYAQPWPSRPIRLVVPFAAGGSADTLGRLVAAALTNSLGQKVYVENLPGAGGLIGVAQIVRAEPDGYSLVVSSFGALAIAPSMNANIEYDPISDFAHIAYLGGSPNSFIVNSASGIRSLDELIERARRDRQAIVFGSAGNGTIGHLVATFLGQKAGVPTEHVPYRGSGPVVTDVVAGHLKLGSVSLAVTLGQVHAGNIRLLAISAQKRIAEFPDVPTFKELGFPELEVTSWFAISGPAGMPEEIVQRLNREIVKTLQQPEMQKRLELEAFEIKLMDPNAFTNFVKFEIARWAPIAKGALAKR